MTELFSEFEEASAVDASSVTLQELDNHIKELMELRELYDVEKKKASETNAKVEEKENFILDLLTALGRQSYEAEGVAKVTKCIQTSYKVPKEIDKKHTLFNYIKGKYGGDALMGLVSINSATLNSWAKKEIETGDISVIPGLELPTSNEYIQVRRNKMRENFMISLSGVNAKGEDIGVAHVFLQHIVYIIKTDKGTMISLSNGSSVTIKEGIDEIIKRTANYGLVRAI